MYATVLTDSFGADYTVGYATPAAFRADTAYPLILYLHGGTGSSLTTKGEKAYDMLMPLADSFSLFLASPSASRSAPWWSPAGMSRVLQTLRFMTLRYPVDPGKVILAGVSDGAAGCYGAANTISSPFAGFIAVSGFGGMLPHFGMRLFPGNIMQRPVYNVNAGKDRIYDINEVNRFLDWLNENGARVERKEYADEMHGFDYRKKEFGAFANYIRTWSKPVARGINWTLVRGFPCCADNLLDCTPDAASDAPHVDAFWKNDTLQMNSKGVREVVVSFPGVTKPFIVVRINKGKTKKIKALPFDPLLALRLMLHNCSPKPQPAAVYRIRID